MFIQSYYNSDRTPRASLYDAKPSGAFLLMGCDMEGTLEKIKPALRIDEQIRLMKSRGLSFKDENAAYCILLHTNYYRLRGYFIDFYEKDNQFKTDTYFEDIYNCYLFDLVMHKSLMPIMETVEVSIKTILAYFIGNELGPLAYLDKSIYKYPENFDRIYTTVDRYMKNHSQSKIVIKHNVDYNGKYPIWVWIEFLSFGDVSLLLTSLKDEYINKINNDYFIFHKRVGKDFLKSWYRSTCKFRNVCSHYERLYSTQLLETPPKITTEKKIIERVDTNKNTELFYYILVADMLCPDIKIIYRFIEDLQKYQSEYSLVNINTKYGFPDDWEEILLQFSAYYIQYYF